MGVQLESLSQSSFEQYGPWPLRDSPFQQAQHVNLGAALLQAAAEFPTLNELSRASKSLRQRAHRPSADAFADLITAKDHLNPSPGSSFASKTRPALSGKPAVLPAATCPWPDVKFALSIPRDQTVLVFPLQKPAAPPQPYLKRRRPDTDVDGFNTAKLACKKRRLLRHLVTSRLSQPFSLPATHILGRDGTGIGDKRYLKLAAMVAARRQLLGPAPPQAPQAPFPPTPNPSSMMRRVAAMNRYRLRARAEIAERCEAKIPNITATRELLQQSPVTAASIDARYPVPSFQLPPPLTPAIRFLPKAQSPLSRARTQARASPPGSPAGLRPAEPAAAISRLSPSPQQRPLRSPEPQISKPATRVDDTDDADDADDGSVAFPTSEHESRYADDPDEYYADFNLIFGGDADSSDDEAAADHYDDYLDEMDGIPWNARA